MNDNTDQNDIGQDEFEEEFEFDESIADEDVLAADEVTDDSIETVAPPPRRGMTLPLIIGVAVLGFIGWKIYGMLTGPKEETVTEVKEAPAATAKSVTKSEKTTVVEKSEPTTPEVPAAEVTQTPSAATLPPPTPDQAQVTPPPAPDEPKISLPPPLPPEPSVAKPSVPTEKIIVPTPPPGVTTEKIIVQTPPTTVITTTEAPKAELSDHAIVNLQKKLDQQQESYTAQVQELEKDIESASQNSADANKGISALQAEIASLSTMVQSLTDELKALRNEQMRQQQARAAKEVQRAVVVAKPARPKVDPVPTLTIHAIIPGRAWLRTQGGKMISVAEGDPVGEYGKVLKVDAGNGVVITTSGVTLR